MSGLLVHEWIEATGGAEKVLRSMGEAFPDADILSLWNDDPSQFGSRKVFETWLAQTKLRRSKALALPFMIPTWRNVRLEKDYEWILASSHLFSHTVRIRGNRDVPKYVYAHTPARYIWTPELDTRGNKLAVRTVAPVFRRIDKSLAVEPAGIAANSEFVRNRIRDTWDRDAEVIYPPVDVDSLSQVSDWGERVQDDNEKTIRDNLPDVFVLGISRFIPYKRLDAVLAAAEILAIPVVLAGNGPELQKLEEMGSRLKVPVHIIKSPSNELVYTLMQRASVLIFPPVEDFGIVPVESQALGTPVVTGPIGGQTETFISGVSGVIAASSKPGDLAQAAEQAIALPTFDAPSITEKFSENNFRSSIRKFVGQES